MSGLGLKVVVTCCIALLVASLAGTIMYAIREDAKRITLNKDQSAAVMYGHAEIVPDEHGNPVFRWKEVGHGPE